jgi:hypothetical protein
MNSLLEFALNERETSVGERYRILQIIIEVAVVYTLRSEWDRIWLTSRNASVTEFEILVRNKFRWAKTRNNPSLPCMPSWCDV